MENNIPVPRAWLEGLIEMRNRIVAKVPVEHTHGFAQLLGYIESAEHILSTSATKKDSVEEGIPDGTPNTDPNEPLT